MIRSIASRKAIASIFTVAWSIFGAQSGYGQPPIEGGKIYWTTPAYPIINWANLDGSNSEHVVVKDSTVSPLNIALDVVGGKMYWTDNLGFQWWQGHGRIRRVDLDGSNIEDLIKDVGARDIALDVERGKMYWTSWTSATEGEGETKIQRADLDGSNTETLVPNHGGHSLSLDLAEGKMYWVWYENDYPEDDTIYRADLDGSNVEDLLSQSSTMAGKIGAFISLIGPLALDTAERKMYWTEYVWRLGDFPLISSYRANLDGSNMEPMDFLLPGDIALDPAGGKLYWTDDHKIRRAGFDGSNIEDLVSISFVPWGIAIDGVGKKMYWTDRDRLRIERADLDGSNAEVLVASLGGRGIAIDGVEDKMYWVHRDTIQRADLDGSNVEIFISGPQKFYDSAYPVDIAVDVVGRKLHWTANELEKGFDSLEDLGFSSYLGFSAIKQANLDDGSNIIGALAIGPVVGIALYVPQPVPTLVSTPSTTPAIPTATSLDPNFPNPFNASTQIAYRLATSGLVRLEIYNVLGQPVHTLVNQFQPAGFYQVRWDARDQRGAAVAAGVYLTRLRHPDGTQTRRLLYLK